MADKNVAVHRLSKLAIFLGGVPDSKFDLSTWIHSPGKTNNDAFNALKDITECGTTACACGWAAMIPEFKTLGFKIVKDDTHSMGQVKFNSESGSEAAATFFNITYVQSCDLFLTHSYPRPQFKPVSRQQVIDKINAMVAKFKLEIAATEAKKLEDARLKSLAETLKKKAAAVAAKVAAKPKLTVTRTNEIKRSIDRLTKLEAALKLFPSKKFSNTAQMGYVRGLGVKASEEERVLSINNKNSYTTVNTLGFAGTIPEFRKAGFKTIVNPSYTNNIDVEYRNARSTSIKTVRPLTGYAAAAKFFGMTDAEANKLFNGYYYGAADSAFYVRRKINAFIAKLQKQLA